MVLNSNPMNLGTGLKASFILHLPAISAKGMILSLTNMVSKLGFDVKPVYSDNSDFYELSNRITLGITEKSAIDNLNSFVSKSLSRKGHTERNLLSMKILKIKSLELWVHLKWQESLLPKNFTALFRL